MLEGIQRHFFHYLILLAILFFGLVFFLLSSHEPQLQLKIITLVLFFYVLWGVAHHYLEKTLTLLVFFEYLLVATVAFVIVSNLLRFT